MIDLVDLSPIILHHGKLQNHVILYSSFGRNGLISVFQRSYPEELRDLTPKNFDPAMNGVNFAGRT